MVFSSAGGLRFISHPAASNATAPAAITGVRRHGARGDRE
jgi:hypothetical protein